MKALLPLLFPLLLNALVAVIGLLVVLDRTKLVPLIQAHFKNKLVAGALTLLADRAGTLALTIAQSVAGAPNAAAALDEAKRTAIGQLKSWCGPQIAILIEHGGHSPATIEDLLLHLLASSVAPSPAASSLAGKPGFARRGLLVAIALGFALALPLAAVLHGCGAAQTQPTPAPQIDARAVIRSVALVALPQARMLIEEQIPDPVARAAVDAAFAPAVDAVNAATSRNICEALPSIDRALVALDGALVRIPSQPPDAIPIEHASILGLRVALQLAFPQCSPSSGSP